MNKICLVCKEEKEISEYGHHTYNICRKCNQKRNRTYTGISDHLGDANTREGAIELLKLIGYDYYHPTKTINQQFIERNYQKLGVEKPY
jgi:hypothetical protein